MKQSGSLKKYSYNFLVILLLLLLLLCLNFLFTSSSFYSSHSFFFSFFFCIFFFCFFFFFFLSSFFFFFYLHRNNYFYQCSKWFFVYFSYFEFKHVAILILAWCSNETCSLLSHGTNISHLIIDILKILTAPNNKIMR